MSLRSPLGRVLGTGSAKSGASHWYAQRVSAVALAALGLWFLVALAGLGGVSYEVVTAWVHRPSVTVPMLLLVVVAGWHAVLGLQVVVEDYVAARGVRTVVLVAVKFVFAVAALSAVVAVLRIGFGVAS
ncbi:MAG: succinate dehydrogenase, hydrophobic membrane anchor protein [Steroidobacteraceae bacterium]